MQSLSSKNDISEALEEYLSKYDNIVVEYGNNEYCIREKNAITENINEKWIFGIMPYPTLFGANKCIISISKKEDEYRIDYILKFTIFRVMLILFVLTIVSLNVGLSWEYSGKVSFVITPILGIIIYIIVTRISYTKVERILKWIIRESKGE